MNGVVEAIQQVSTIFGEITSASHEQSTGIDQVTRAVAQMEEVTQQNAALVEESAAAAESMREQAMLLSELVSRFKLEDAKPREEQTRARRTAALTEKEPARRPPASRIAAEARNSALGLPTHLDGQWEEF